MGEYLRAQPWSNFNSSDNETEDHSLYSLDSGTDNYIGDTEDIVGENEENVVNFLTTVVFTVSCYQYLSVATVFSKGPPYRRPFFTNTLFTVSVAVLASFTAILYLNLIP